MECPFERPVEAFKANNFYRIRNKTGGVIGDFMTCEEADYIVQALNSYEKQVKQIEALKSVCEKYIPANKMDEANDEVIMLSVGIAEEIGRKLLAKKTKEAEKL